MLRIWKHFFASVDPGPGTHITNWRRLNVRATSSLVGPTSGRRRSEVDFKSFRRRLDAKRTVFDLVATSPWRPLFDQPNLYWSRPPSITDLLRPTVELLQPPTTYRRPLYDQTKLICRRPPSMIDLVRPTVNLLQPPTTSTATSLRPKNLSWRRPLTLIDLLRPTVNLLQPPTTSTATSFWPTKPILASSPVYNRPATTSHD